MYEDYTRALQVLDVLERTCEKLQLNRPIKLVSNLRRKGLLAEPSIAYLMDSLRPNEAKRFCEAMAFIEGHFARLKLEDKIFVRTEAPATKGFYMSHLRDHTTVIELARRKPSPCGGVEWERLVHRTAGQQRAEVWLGDVDEVRTATLRVVEGLGHERRPVDAD